MYAKRSKILVVGASGVVGSAFLRNIGSRGDVQAIGLSRRPLASPHRHLKNLKYDLMDPQLGGSEKKKLESDLHDVTHALYAAYIDHQSEEEILRLNTSLFLNTTKLITKLCPQLQHITLMQGMKAYGTHLGPHKTPSQERDPRLEKPHFYYSQEDILKEVAAYNDWGWTVLRPHVVIGPALRSPMNLAVIIGVYAALCREKGQPLMFPGISEAFYPIYQATDSGLLARAIEWAGTNSPANGEIFNITNGDFFRWCHMWPAIANHFGLQYLGPADSATYSSLQERFRDAQPVWKTIADREKLLVKELDGLVSWKFGDYVFQIDWDVMADTLKCRKAGFLEFIDSEGMFLDRLTELQSMKIIP